MKTFIKFTVLILFLTIAITAWANESTPTMATEGAYFDIATGHQYFKNMDSTYTEFSSIGKVLNIDVPNDRPLLVSGKYIRTMPSGSYLLYEKRGTSKMERQVLPMASNHPNGWQIKEALISYHSYTYQEDTGLGYSKDPNTLEFNGHQIIATGPAYYDKFTNHTYIKNSDTTYAEFSKKGKLLRSDVPNHLTLLTSSRNIFDLNQKDFFIYEKTQNGKMIQQILSAKMNHPEGWRLKDLLSTIQ